MLFCLLADVRIRETSKNRKGLQHALRGIRDAGGTIDKDWPVERAFETGDKATQTNVLTTPYSEIKDKPVYVDLNALWHQLGVNSSNGIVSLDDTAPARRDSTVNYVRYVAVICVRKRQAEPSVTSFAQLRTI